MNGGKGEPSKTGGAKHPFLLCRPTALRFVAARGIYLPDKSDKSDKSDGEVIPCIPKINQLKEKNISSSELEDESIVSGRDIEGCHDLEQFFMRTDAVMLKMGSEVRRLFCHQPVFDQACAELEVNIQAHV